MLASAPQHAQGAAESLQLLSGHTLLALGASTVPVTANAVSFRTGTS
jgi:hypothetical protein